MQKQKMKKSPDPGIAQNPIVNACRGTISGGSKERAAPINRRVCECCSKLFCIRRSKQRFCSSRCRLLYWAAGEIAREYSAGNACGLREFFEKLKL